MKLRLFLAGAVAVIAIAGCNSRQSDAGTRAATRSSPASSPSRRDWTQVVNATASGGFVMGNPDAKVKLIEFGSMTCPHCKAFDDEGVPNLLGYVKSGQVSWEFRNYVRDAFDVTAALLARCDGAKSFFPLTHDLYADQAKWQAKFDSAPQDQIKAMQDLPPDQQFVALAKVAGFPQWAQARGLPIARSSQCLSNENSVNQLIRMADDTTTQFPDFEGTPTFVVNGKISEATTWDDLEPQLKAALGKSS